MMYKHIIWDFDGRHDNDGTSLTLSKGFRTNINDNRKMKRCFLSIITAHIDEVLQGYFNY